MSRDSIRDLENYSGQIYTTHKGNLDDVHEGKQLDHIFILESIGSQGHVKLPEISKERLTTVCHHTRVRWKSG